jgi:large subunit ribosomal protein L22
MKAHLRSIRISSKKINVVAGLVRRKPVQEALNFLKFTPKKSAKILYKVISSAASNATHNDSAKIDNLFIDEIVITKGPVMRRSIASSRGRSLPIHKPTAHISIKLSIK